MRVRARSESWPIEGGFRIARGGRRNAEVVVVEIEVDGDVGRGECVPYPRYGESVESVRNTIDSTFHGVRELPTREMIQESMAPGAARSAVDCALWDLEAKRSKRPVWESIGMHCPPDPVQTMRTISVASPEAMARVAAMQPPRSMLKVKVDGGPDLARITAVHERAPDSPLVIDANEAWSERQLSEWLPKLVDLGVLVIEQPLPADDDAALCSLRGGIPFCADESFFDRDSFERVEGRYEIVNIKLDKAGGLTEAWACMKEAEALGLQRMVGCMVSTSLAIAPACLLATSADFVDLDGPLLLERDRTGALHDPSRSLIHHSPRIWGGA